MLKETMLKEALNEALDRLVEKSAENKNLKYFCLLQTVLIFVLAGLIIW